MDVVTFRDDEFSSTFYLATAIEADSMLYAPTSDRFHLRGALFDDAWIAELRFADMLRAPDMPVAQRDGVRVIELIRTLALPFGRYHIAVTLEDSAGAAASIMRSDADARRYARDGVALSDILLQRAPDTPGAAFARHGRKLYPNTGRYYPAGDAVRPYFEVYNLDVIGGRSDYQLSYSIYEAEKQVASWRRWANRLVEFTGAGDELAPAISQTFDRSGDSHVEHEELIINIESLPTGDYELVIDVRDNISGGVAQVVVAFTVGNKEQAKN
jgi:hypothetical protein